MLVDRLCKLNLEENFALRQKKKVQKRRKKRKKRWLRLGQRLSQQEKKSHTAAIGSFVFTPLGTITAGFTRWVT